MSVLAYNLHIVHYQIFSALTLYENKFYSPSTSMLTNFHRSSVSTLTKVLNYAKFLAYSPSAQIVSMLGKYAYKL